VLGAGVGALVLMPFTTGNAENLFSAAWVGVGGTAIAFFLVLFTVTEPRKESFTELVRKQASLKTGEKKKSTTPILIQRILTIAIVASFLDSAGDEGTRIARGTIMQNVWPETNQIMIQNILMLSTIGLIFIVLALINFLKAKIGFGLTTCLGSCATIIAQILFMINWTTWYAFIAVWYAGKLFGFLSTFGANLLINLAAPEAETGYWSGLSEGTNAIAEAIATLTIAAVYDSMQDGSDEGKRGKTALYITVAISALAFLCYTPLTVYAPRGFLEDDTKKKYRTLDEYAALTEAELKTLTLDEYNYLEEHSQKAGNMPRMVKWGTYKDEVAEIPGLMERAGDDFNTAKSLTIASLSSREKMQQELEQYKGIKQFLTTQLDLDAERLAMGKWFADYLDDAGYESWVMMPQLYKAMLMNAFPPIDALDNKMAFEEPEKVTVAQLENMYLKFLKVADSHISVRSKQVGLINSVGLARILRKRK